MKKIILCSAIFLSMSLTFSQSSEKITEILNAQEATYGHIAYLCNVYSASKNEKGLEKAESASFEESFTDLKKTESIGDEISASDAIKLSKVVFFFAKATDMKGGIWYSIKPSARYALREAKSRKIVPENADPSKKISGRDALDLFSAFSSETAQN